MKISFIVPVYKVEAYLDACIKSVVSQTYRDIEIILVDDGSPDNCPALCDAWAAKDKRIVSVHKKNGGLSDARNYGMQYATGDYVIFLDSDDFWMSSDCLENLISIIKCHPEADFVGFNCSYYYNDTETFVPWQRYSGELSTPHSNDDAIILLTKTSSFTMSAWSKIIRRELLVDNNITFKVGQLSEDIPWFINLLEKSRQCIFANIYVNGYRQNVSGSITNNIGLRNINSLIDIVETELQKIEQRKFSKEAKDCLYSFLAYEYSIILGYLMYLDKETAEEKYQYLKQYRWLLKYTIDPKVKKVSWACRILGLRLTTKLLQYRIKRMYSK